MDSYVKSSHAKRFVIEDSITKVTSDGEPHEMMTMIAGLSGLIAAIAILTILASLVGCKKSKRAQHCKNCASNKNLSKLEIKQCVDSKPAQLTPVSLEEGGVQKLHPTSIATIYTGNLKGNLNSAFVDSELNLSGSLTKKKKKTHWSDEIEGVSIKETAINLHRF